MSKSKSAVEEFDEALQHITDDRGAIYGHPLDDFSKIEALKAPLRACKNIEIRHALEMIAVKMARLVETPDHVDSIVDIAGYARCMVMIIQEQQYRKDSELFPDVDLPYVTVELRATKIIKSSRLGTPIPKKK